jgi:SAM-dependent methyltransferase
VALTSETAALAARARCPACGEAPLGADGDALVCSACAQRWRLLSRHPLAVRLATADIETIGEPFREPPLAVSSARRALRRWHSRREQRFARHIPALADAQSAAIGSAYEELPSDQRAVLDVGGGTGRWRKLLGVPGDYTIIDVVSPEHLTLDPDSVYVVGDAAALPFASGAFGLVLMIEVLQHLPEPTQALAEAKRVLAANGVLVVSTRQAWPTQGAPNDYFRFTRYGLEHMLRPLGFSALRFVPLGGPASVVTGALENNLRLLTKPLVKQFVGHPLWRLASLLDRTVFRESLTGPSPDVSGWLVIARAGEDRDI